MPLQPMPTTTATDKKPQPCQECGHATRTTTTAEGGIITRPDTTRACTAQTANYMSKLPEFSGTPHEDPVAYTHQCEVRLACSGITIDEWPENTSERLRGPAHEWWQRWGRADMEWSEFTEALNHRFNAGSTLVQCTSQFYSSTQREGEPVEEFIAHKIQLFRRISPLVEPIRALPTITLLLRDELQPLLRISRATSVEDYVQLAVAT
ncbi:activity-regulated cytoskeleton-associated protein-like [Bacillus rossius redtenbacheri]|uniref:activity-regulated cytoskeleton-associated protein-like n=1 Tax=Bacillus rossius redtenbacheri TaxID=93214 RepID=UPI002FDE73D2